MPRSLRDVIAKIFAPFTPPPRLQVAALCWRPGDAGLEVLLVTTRNTGRWTPPRGWPMKGKTLAEAAAQEAWEEAGVSGVAEEAALGSYNYDKLESRGGRGEPIRVEVFALRVAETAQKYPEAGQRRRRWLSQAEASDAVREPALKALIEALAP